MAGEIRIGLGSCCVAQGSREVHEAIDRVLSESGAPALVKRVGCVGMCHQTPMLEIVPPDGSAKFFSKVNADEARDIVLRHFQPKSFLERARRSAVGLLDRFLTDEVGDHRARTAPRLQRLTVTCGLLLANAAPEVLRDERSLLDGSAHRRTTSSSSDRG